MRDAVGLALALRDPTFDRALVVVLSEGVDTMRWLSETQVTASAARSDAVIYAVMSPSSGRPSAQSAASGTYLADQVRQTAGRVMHLNRRRDLTAAFREVLEEARARYVLTYYPRRVPSTGWHDLRVSVKGRRVQIRARRGYFRGSRGVR